MQRALVFAFALAACSGGTGASTSGHGTGPAPVHADAAAAIAAAPLTIRECDELIAHAVALAGSARGSGSATPAELDTVAASLRDDLGVRCATLPREAARCAMAATSLAALSACE